MQRTLWTMTTVLCLLGPLASGRADDVFDAPGNFNPLVPGYFADPTVKKFGDTFYLYATTDGNGGGRGPATVWVSHDFVNWILVPMNWPTTPFYWAPDVVQREGRFYLYYNQPCNTFGGVSDTPNGPWTPLTPGDGLVIKDRLVKDVITLDTQLFEDKDGTLYGYWGTWGIFPNSGCGFGVFNPDMKSFARLGMIPNTQAKEFFEAPLMIERNGVYYFTYSSGSCHDASYRVQYAVGIRPDGEFAMGPNNPILATSSDGRVHGPGHHSILRQGDDYFIIYHRHDIPFTPNGMHRQVCADRLIFAEDGVIQPVQPTHHGIGDGGKRLSNLAATKKVTASSFYQDTLRQHDYRPEYAVDDNNATLWRPADNQMGHSLTVDLGRPERVRRTHVQFEYATWFYQYLIETSVDGQTWQVFADRRQNYRWGSPLVDDGDIEAQYLRLTVTGTELPGLFGAIWNFKVFSEAPADPLLEMAERAFARVAASTPRDSHPSQGPLRISPMDAPQVDAAGQPVSAAWADRLLIHLDVSDLQFGQSVATWSNRGTLGGEFTSGDDRPVVKMSGGRKAVRFSGQQTLRASFPAPRSLAGNSSFTVAAWVNNPQIAESECLVSWAGRGGPDATTAQVGYGAHGEWGAVGHWGFADMAFRGGPPSAGTWHHLAVVFDGVIERVYVDGQLNNSEAKMLLMHEGRPVYVGGSDPATECFDGYLASLRLYAAALPESDVQALAADEPSAGLLVHLDSARLAYGPLSSWKNDGVLGGEFVGGEKLPKVEDLEGRLGVRFEPGESLDLALPEAQVLADVTVLLGITNPQLEPGECALELLDGAGTRTAFLLPPLAAGWHQAVLVYRDGVGTFFVDGQATTRTVAPAPASLQTIRLGGPESSSCSFSGTLSRVQIFRSALTAAEISQVYAVWKGEWHRPTPSPATYAQKPVALCPTAVAMISEPGQAEGGGLEYLFSETTGNPGGSSSGWIPAPYFLDDGLIPNTHYSYTLQMRDALGNVTTPSNSCEATTNESLFRVYADSFTTPRDFLTEGVRDTVWDGYLDSDSKEGSQAAAIVADAGGLRLQSQGTVWDGNTPRGPWLYRLVSGDFVVQVQVVDYAGLAVRRTPGNTDGGLMVRVPDLQAAGPGEDLVQLNFFPIWGQGNMVTNLDGARVQKGNRLEWEAHRHLQILRHGTLFHFRTSADGTHWSDMPGSPVERPDMAGIPLEVGVFHASYGGDSSYIAFRDFRLICLAGE
ncbi:MAG: family 43 glycosylhydrolase [Pirellulaceae bacterium]